MNLPESEKRSRSHSGEQESLDDRPDSTTRSSGPEEMALRGLFRPLAGSGAVPERPHSKPSGPGLPPKPFELRLQFPPMVQSREPRVAKLTPTLVGHGEDAPVTSAVEHNTGSAGVPPALTGGHQALH